MGKQRVWELDYFRGMAFIALVFYHFFHDLQYIFKAVEFPRWTYEVGTTIIAGTFLMMSNRFKNADKVGVGSYFDWLLIGIIGTIGVSGTLAWLTRVAGISGLAYPIYFIHLVVVLSLFTYLPFSKLAHMFYRGAALSFNKYSGREAQVEAQPAVEAETATSEAPSEAEQTETKQE